MTLRDLELYEEKIIKFEKIRIKNLGYSDSDAEIIIKDSMEKGMIKVLLLDILRELKRKS